MKAPHARRRMTSKDAIAWGKIGFMGLLARLDRSDARLKECDRQLKVIEVRVARAEAKKRMQNH